SRVVDFRVSVNGSPFVSSLGSVQDGTFTLPRSVLEVVLGHPLADGNVSVRVTATDEHGNVTPPHELDFVLDTARPATPSSLQLAPGSDPGLVGDGITDAATVTVLTTAPTAGADVVLFANGVAVQRVPGGGPVSFTLTPAEGNYSLVAQ